MRVSNERASSEGTSRERSPLQTFKYCILISLEKKEYKISDSAYIEGTHLPPKIQHIVERQELQKIDTYRYFKLVNWIKVSFGMIVVLSSMTVLQIKTRVKITIIIIIIIVVSNFRYRVSRSDWFKFLSPFFQPNRSDTKTNRGSRGYIFPRFVSATCNYFEF